MKRYVIDTNALISFVTDRNPDQQRKIAPLFEAAAYRKAVILCHQYVLTEFVFVMDKVYHLPKAGISRMILDLLQMPGIEVVQNLDFHSVLSCWPDPFTDFGDAVIASVGLSSEAVTIVTFDRRFADRLKALGLEIYR